MKGTIRVEGLDELILKINGDPVYGAPLGRWMRETVADAKAATEDRAPTAKGTMKTTITSKMMAGPVPLWGVVSTDYSKGGARIPFILEAGRRRPKNGKEVKLHYRSTSRQGESTAKWFTGALAAVRKAAVAKLSDVEREIEALWNR